MAAGRRSTRKADTKAAVPTEAADSTTKTIKAKGGKKVNKVPEKIAEVVEAAEVPESGDEQVDEVGDVEMENAEAEPKKPATKAASKKKQVKAKPGNDSSVFLPFKFFITGFCSYVNCNSILILKQRRIFLFKLLLIVEIRLINVMSHVVQFLK